MKTQKTTKKPNQTQASDLPCAQNIDLGTNYNTSKIFGRPHNESEGFKINATNTLNTRTCQLLYV